MTLAGERGREIIDVDARPMRTHPLPLPISQEPRREVINVDVQPSRAHRLPRLGSPGQEREIVGVDAEPTRIHRHQPGPIPQEREREIINVDAHPSQRQGSSATLRPDSQDSIRYLPRRFSAPLGLVPEEEDTFSALLRLIGEYEAVINSQESLALSLGANLAGSRLFEGVEMAFEGPINVSSHQPLPTPVRWLDVIAFSRANPYGFTLIQRPDGSRWCQFFLQEAQMEITENDWKALWSNSLNRYPLDEPLEEDELAELATIEILEQRFSNLSFSADEVAASARSLNLKLGQRKQYIERRRYFPNTASLRHQPIPPSQTPYDIHADLMRQFLGASTAAATNTPEVSKLNFLSSVLRLPPVKAENSQRKSLLALQKVSISVSNDMPPLATRDSTTPEDGQDTTTENTEQDANSKVHTPPCERCGSLKIDCQRHTAACLGCTKWRVKCVWAPIIDNSAANARYDRKVKEAAARLAEERKRRNDGATAKGKGKTAEKRTLDIRVTNGIITTEGRGVPPEGGWYRGYYIPPLPPGVTYAARRRIPIDG